MVDSKLSYPFVTKPATGTVREWFAARLHASISVDVKQPTHIWRYTVRTMESKYM